MMLLGIKCQGRMKPRELGVVKQLTGGESSGWKSDESRVIPCSNSLKSAWKFSVNPLYGAWDLTLRRSLADQPGIIRKVEVQLSAAPELCSNGLVV